MTNSMNNIDKKTDSYLNDNFFSEERQKQISGNISQNKDAETKAREDKARAEKSRKRKNRAALIGTMLVAATATVASGNSEDNHQRAVAEQNAPLVKKIQENVEANEMQQKSETIGADQTEASALAEKQVIDSANEANRAEVEETNQAIVDANR